MLKSTFGEFTMILPLLKILFPHLCLFLIINMCSMFHESYMIVCLFFKLVFEQSICRRKMGLISVLFIFICTIPFMLTRNAPIFGVLKSMVLKPFVCCPYMRPGQ
jgi:hypothetical protein